MKVVAHACLAACVAACGGAPSVGRVVPPNDAGTDVEAQARGLPGHSDTTFAEEGLLVGDPVWMPLGVAAGVDGSIVVSGVSLDGTDPPPEIVRRFMPSGGTDASFGQSGKSSLPANPSPLPQSIAILPNTQIEVAGATYASTGGAGLAFRLGADGLPDSTFGTGGLTTVVSVGQASGALVEPDGSAIVLGSQSVVRLMANGVLDPTFTGAGTTQGASAGALGPSGTIVLAHGLTVRRILADGTLDATFATGGQLLVPFGDAASTNARIVALVLGPDGQFVVAGSHLKGTDPYVDVARFTSAGSLDSAFAGGAPASVRADFASGAAVLGDGRVVVWTQSGLVVGYRPDGSPDASLGAAGIAYLDVLGTIVAGTVDAQERLIVAGLTTDTASPSWFVRRYWL